MKEVAGVLVFDAEGRQIRFEADGRAGYVISYERIIAMHYEKAEYPRRFLRRSSFYLTVHYSDVGGPPAFETIRLLSERDALSAVATLERDTGGTFDRSAATQSFLGIPIRARECVRAVFASPVESPWRSRVRRVRRQPQGKRTLRPNTPLPFESPGENRQSTSSAVRRVTNNFTPTSPNMTV